MVPYSQNLIPQFAEKFIVGLLFLSEIIN